MKKSLIFTLILSLSFSSLFAKVEVRKDAKGWRMFDDGKEIEVKGITWSNTPIGMDYNYSLWRMDDDFIYATLDTDMPLLKAMGVNVIRSFDDVPPKWVEYIYDKYGIYTLINNLMGRYGVTVKGKWIFPTDYQDKATREALVEMARATAKKYKDVRGLLFYMLGNESNYGLEWTSTEIENLPVGEQQRAKAVYLYSMFEEAMKAVHEVDPNHPVGIVNGDTQYIDLIAELCPSLDIFGSNVYRGWKFYDAFYEDVLTKLDKPAVFTECGADAFNALTQKEDQWAQLQYFKSQWEEVYQEGYGKGRHQNILGAFVFEWIDEWWKIYQWKDLEIHNANASWANSGYSLDFKEGTNNMNEEWFGLCAISTQTLNGVNKRVPRAVYYFFCDLWKHSLYNSTNEEIDAFFKTLPESIYLARGDSSSVREDIAQSNAVKIRSLDISAQYTAPVFINYLQDDIKDKKNWRDTLRYPNGITKNGENAGSTNGYSEKYAEDIENKPTFQAESTLVLDVNPVERVNGSVTLKAMTGEPFTRLRDHNMSYYESVPDDDSVYEHKKYFDFYAADATYEGTDFDIKGYYHAGHAGYADSGDIFNITQDAFDLAGYDRDGDKAPIAAEFIGKGKFNGLKVIGGPEIYGYAAPQIVANYYRGFFPGLKWLSWMNVGGVVAEEFGQSEHESKAPANAYGYGRKASVYGEFYFNNVAAIKLGALTAGSEKVGAEYDSKKNGRKKITDADTFGGYASLSTRLIPYFNVYVNGIYRGLVADTNAAGVYGGFFTGDSGSGNRIEIQSGFDFALGAISFKPVFRMRMPIEEPTGSRDITQGSPFYVGQGNRESMEIEAVFTYDPEGGTYFHNWDNNETENAPIAFSLTGLYKLFEEQTDLLPYKSANSSRVQRNDGTWVTGDDWYTSAAMKRQEGLWQVGARVVTNPTNNLRLIATLNAGHLTPAVAYFGNTKEEPITFYGGSLAVRYKRWIASSSVTVDGWGPEGWHRDQNWTFPLQYSFDIAYGFKKPSFLDNKNRIGLRFLGTNYGEFSNDSYGALPYAYHRTATASLDGAKYMEVTAYFNISL